MAKKIVKKTKKSARSTSRKKKVSKASINKMIKDFVKRIEAI